MSLRLKITLLLFAVISVSVVANFLIQRVAVLPSFRQLEHEEALADWNRCQKAIEREIATLDSLCFDWASWDDAYAYVQGNNPAFYEANLKNPDWFVDQKIDVLFFCHPDGQVFWSHIAADESGKPVTLTWLPTDRLPAEHPLLAVKAEKDSSVTGLVGTELGTMMIAARPVLTSKNQGPLAGVLIFGRLISAETEEALRTQTGVHFDLFNIKSGDLPASERVGIAGLAGLQGPQEDLVDARSLSVRGVLNGIDGSPLLLIKTVGVRHIAQQGEAAIRFATLSLVVAGASTLVVLLLALRSMVITPLGELTTHATHVGESGELKTKIDMRRTDELGTLAKAFQKMLEQLEDLRAGAVAMSRQAGMAEVAAGVLHNVGNAMTNVNVLAETLSGRISKSRVPNVGKVAALLKEHQADLPEFIAQSPQGKQIPEYIAQLSTHLNTELADIQQDLGQLREGLQHVKAIVASHQGLATSTNFLESVDLRAVLAESRLLVDASLIRHGVALEIPSGPPIRVSCDRAKLSQVLVNLLTNAKEALVESRTPAPKITVRLQEGASRTVAIEIADNGPGIAPANRERLFSKGFTTKAEGHGIGLHYSWLAVREMRGTLSIAKQAPGTGATFRIELPCDVAEQKVAA